MKPVFILNGPNLNRLGLREPDIYGHETLSDLEAACRVTAQEFDLSVFFEQCNHEGALIDLIHRADAEASGLILNPAGFGHSSIALLDALLSISVPIVEVHLSNIYKREAFRHHTLTSPAAKGVICGFGGESYLLALRAMKTLLGA